MRGHKPAGNDQSFKVSFVFFVDSSSFQSINIYSYSRSVIHSCCHLLICILFIWGFIFQTFTSNTKRSPPFIELSPQDDLNRVRAKHLQYFDVVKSSALLHIYLQEVKQQRSSDVYQRFHVQHLGQPAPAVVQAVRNRLTPHRDPLNACNCRTRKPAGGRSCSYPLL